MRQIPILLIKAYQHTLGPALPVVLGSGCGCRFAPTCSQYAIEALDTHGVLTGSFLAARRVLRCHPFNPGGIDLVPPNPKRSERSATQAIDPVGLVGVAFQSNRIECSRSGTLRAFRSTQAFKPTEPKTDCDSLFPQNAPTI